MSAYQKLLIFTVISICCEYSNGIPFSLDDFDAAQLDISQATLQDEKLLSKREFSNLLKTVLHEKPDHPVHWDTILHVLGHIADHIKECHLPTIWFIATAIKVLIEKFIEVAGIALTPETSQKIKLVALGLLKKLMKYDFLKPFLHEIAKLLA